MQQKVHPTCCQTMRNLLLMLVSCSDRAQAFFQWSKEEIINYPSRHLWSCPEVQLSLFPMQHFPPDQACSTSVSSYKVCGLTWGRPLTCTLTANRVKDWSYRRQNKADMATAHVPSAWPWLSHWPPAYISKSRGITSLKLSIITKPFESKTTE